MFGFPRNEPPGFKKLGWVGAVAVLLNPPPEFKVDVPPKMLFV